MVSAKPKRPKGPLESESCSRPTRQPTSKAESELPRRPCSATSTRKTSTTWPKTGDTRMPMKWTSAARTTAARSLRVCTGTDLFDARRHGLILQQIDLVQGTEVDRRRELDTVEELPAGFDGDDGAHRDAARIDAVDAGGEHAVPRPHVGLQRHVVALEPAAPPAAADHSLPAGAQDQAADAGGTVGDELDLGIGAGDGDDPPHQPVARQHRLID